MRLTDDVLWRGRRPLSFLAAAIRSIHTWADELEGWQEELDFVPLVAQLFAVGTQLLLNEGSARLMVRLDPPVPRTDLELLRLQLAKIPDTIEVPALYGTIVAALITVESVLLKVPSLAAALRPYTELRPLGSAVPAAGCRDLWGRVYHWIRPASSALAALRVQRFEHARSSPPDPMPHPGIYLRRLALYWDSDPQLPGLARVEPTPRIAAFFRDSGEDVADRRRFRIALCPLEGPFHPRFSIKEDGRFFQVHRESPMAGADALRAHLDMVVQAAAEEEVKLIVLPELTVDARARYDLQTALQRRSAEKDPLYGVVAGSFHLWDADAAATPEGCPVNEAAFLDRTGTLVMAHHKKGRFRIASSRVGSRLFAEVPRELHKEIFEDIRYGSELSVLETSLGRLAVLICADAIAADDRGYLPLVRRLRPDLLLIVSMSDETEPFAAFAEEMSRYWIGTIFVNAHRILEEAHQARAAGQARPGPGDSEPPKEDAVSLLAAWNFALYEADDCPPTLGRWVFGREPECFYFKPCKGGPKGWRPLSRDPVHSGVSLLRHQDRSIGLVLDLGVHWKDPGEKGKEQEIFR